jgi:hypothetical protein
MNKGQGMVNSDREGMYHLREAQVPYNSDFTPENSDLRAKNT